MGRRLVNLVPEAQRTHALTNGVVGRTRTIPVRYDEGTVATDNNAAKGERGNAITARRLNYHLGYSIEIGELGVAHVWFQCYELSLIHI